MKKMILLCLALFAMIGAKAQNYGAYAVALETNVMVGEPDTLTARFYNVGDWFISRFDFTARYAGHEIRGSHQFDNVVRAKSGTLVYYADFEIPIPAVDELGEQPVVISIDRIDGQENHCDTVVTAYVHVNSIRIKKRALMEEYTGTWCQWCPWGFVGMENLQKAYGDDFIGVSIHNGDPMAVATYYQPSAYMSYPSGYLNRSSKTDVYSGIVKNYKTASTGYAPADVQVKAVLDTLANQVDVTSTLTFPRNHEGLNYGLIYLLVANGLDEAHAVKVESSTSNGSWTQASAFYGDQTQKEDMKIFTESRYVSGLTFNFVLAAHSGFDPIAGSVPETVTAYEPVVGNYSLSPL